MNQDKIWSQNYITPKPLETRIELHRRFSVNRQGWRHWVLESLNR